MVVLPFARSSSNAAVALTELDVHRRAAGVLDRERLGRLAGRHLQRAADARPGVTLQPAGREREVRRGGPVGLDVDRLVVPDVVAGRRGERVPPVRDENIQ